MTKPKSLIKFLYLNYAYIGITVLSYLFLYLIDLVGPYTYGSMFRLLLTTGLFFALIKFKGKTLFLIFRINILLLIISYLIHARTEVIDTMFWIGEEGVVANILPILIILIMSVVPVAIMIWILLISDIKQVKSYFKKQDFSSNEPERTPSLFKVKYSSESLEYLGLAPADFITYLSIGATAVGFYLNDVATIIPLYIVGIVLGVYAIKIGAKTRSDFSSLTNLLKKYSYHLSLGIVLIAMIYRLFKL